MTMYSNDPEPSAPSSARPSPSTRRSQVANNPPSHRMVLSHHRTSSTSALTVQTHFARQSTVQSQQIHQEPSATPHFSHLLNTVLGSPFLTTADISQAPSHFSLDGHEVEERDPYQLRPPSPTPTADYSIIDVEEVDVDSLPVLRIPGSYPYGHQRSMSSSFAGLGLHSNSTWSNQRGRSCYTNPGPGPPFASFNHPTGSMSTPNVLHPSNPLRTFLPRLWDALSFPGRAIISGSNKSSSSIPSPTSSNPSTVGSPVTFPHSISLPTTLLGAQPLSGRQSPFLWGNLPKSNNNKGKGKAQPSHDSLPNSESAEDSDSSELSPLDGEEGELVDEACFVDVIAITGIDILALLPPELALYVLHLVCPPPLSRDPHTTRSGVLSNEAEESSKAALHAILSCLSVSRKWRRLADDNSVWRTLFLARWDIDLRRADLSHMRKVGSVVRFVGTPPRHQQRRHKWNFKHKAQALKSGVSLGASTDPSHALSSPVSAPIHRVRPVSQPDESFPLWFDWKKMYMERLELERRWRGTAYTCLPTPPLEAPRETGRCMTSRGAPRSRSLSPARLLGPTSSSSGPAVLNTSPTSSGLDQPAALSGLENVVPNLGTIPSSRTEPVGLGALLYREKKWEPDMMELKGHMDSVYCVEFDSKRIITGSRDRSIMVWSLRTGKLLGSFPGAHRGSVLCLKFEKDWDFSPVCLSPTIGKGRSGNTSTSLSADLDFNSGSNSDMEYGLDGGLRSKKTSGFMVSGSSDCTICVWKLENGNVLGGEGSGDDGMGRIEDGEREVKAKRVAILKGHTGGVLDLRIDQKWIVSSSKDTVVRVWDRKSLKLHRMLRGHEAPVNAIGLQDGKVVSASGDGRMILWDIESGKRLRTLEGRDRGLTCIEFKDNLIVSGSNECQIRLWDAWTGECLRTISGHNALVRALSFDPRTGRLVSASYDRVIKLWDLRTGKLIRQFKHIHAGYIYDVKFDVGKLISSSHDHRVCVFDFTAGLDASVFV